MNNLVKQFYNNNPYPCFSRFANIKMPPNMFEDACFKVKKPIPERPSILVIGCGTVAASAIARAYPNASNLTALDLSPTTLELAQKNTPKVIRDKIHWVQGDIADPDIKDSLPVSKYDWIHCTGVLHHLEYPELGIANISQLLSETGIVRFQLYSKGGRQWIEWARAVFIQKEAQTVDDVVNILVALTKYHPFRYVMATYPESFNKAGLRDGFLHPLVKTFYAKDWNDLLKNHGLQISIFDNLHYLDALDDIFSPKLLDAFNELDLDLKITVLEKLGEWRSDFSGIITRHDHHNIDEEKERIIKTDILCDIEENISYPRHYIWQEAKSALNMLSSDLQKEDIKYLLTHLSPRLWLPGFKGLLMRFKWASWQDMSRDLASSSTIFKDNIDDLIDDYYDHHLNSYIPSYETWPWKQWENGFFGWDWDK